MDGQFYDVKQRIVRGMKYLYSAQSISLNNGITRETKPEEDIWGESPLKTARWKRHSTEESEMIPRKRIGGLIRSRRISYASITVESTRFLLQLQRYRSIPSLQSTRAAESPQVSHHSALPRR